MIGLLVGRSEPTKDQYVFVGDLVETTAFEADPVGVLLDSQVQGLPVLPPSDVELLYQVGSLAPIESRYDIQRLVVKCYCCMEVPPSIETSNLSP